MFKIAYMYPVFIVLTIVLNILHVLIRLIVANSHERIKYFPFLQTRTPGSECCTEAGQPPTSAQQSLVSPAVPPHLIKDRHLPLPFFKSVK